MASFSYLDTSFLVKGYITEEGSSIVQKHVRDVDTTLWVSRLTDIEMAATLPKRLNKAEATLVHSVYRSDRDIGVYVEVAMIPPVWEMASDLLLRQTGPFLGSLDALHLAAALYHGATHMATYDGRLATAAYNLGLSVVGARP